MRKGITKSLIISMTALLLIGCGASATPEIAMENYDTAIYNQSAAPAEAAGGAAEAGVPETSARKLIRNVDLNVETEEYDALTAAVTKQTKELGGYIENEDTGETENGGRNGSMTIRVPQEKLDELLGKVAEHSNITYKRESIDDVTLQYVDLEAHIESLQTERDALMTMLESAEKLEDVIAIQSRISEVRYQIESMESQRRVLQNQVDYSTLQLSITEVESVRANTWEKVKLGFKDSLHGVTEGFAGFFVGLLINLPYIVSALAVFAIIGLLVWFIVWIVQKKSKK